MKLTTEDTENTERATPETDSLRERFLTAGEWPDLFAHARRLERERDEAREQNAKLRDIAERAIYSMEWEYENPHAKAKIFRSELDQLKEGGK